MSTKKIQIVGSLLKTDETMTQPGVPADAQAVGSRLGGLTFSINENGIITVSIKDEEEKEE